MSYAKLVLTGELARGMVSYPVQWPQSTVTLVAPESTETDVVLSMKFRSLKMYRSLIDTS